MKNITNMYPTFIEMIQKDIDFTIKRFMLLRLVDPLFKLYIRYCAMLNLKSSEYENLKTFMLIENKEIVVQILSYHRNSQYGILFEAVDEEDQK